MKDIFEKLGIMIRDDGRRFFKSEEIYLSVYATGPEMLEVLVEYLYAMEAGGDIQEVEEKMFIAVQKASGKPLEEIKDLLRSRNNFNKYVPC